jgi:hypothetical protein
MRYFCDVNIFPKLDKYEEMSEFNLGQLVERMCLVVSNLIEKELMRQQRWWSNMFSIQVTQQKPNC